VEILEAVSLIEAPKSGKWFARLIEADKQGSSAYYSSAALQRSVGKFTAGTHMYVNHMSMTEKEDRPEGDLNNLVGVLEGDGVMRPDGIYAPVRIYSDKRDWVMERASDIGLSIRAEGAVQEVNGRKELVEISKVHSVDLVTRAGAGGKFVSIMESARDSVVESAERQKEDETLEFPKELAESLDTLAKDMKALMEAIADDRKAAKDKEEALAEAERKAGEPKAPSAGEIAGALREAKLSPKAEARVIASVEKGEGLAEAIKAEQEIAAEVLAEAQKSGDLGGGHIDNESEKLTEAQRADKVAANFYGN
jgi:hypothetical protein